MTSLTAHPLAEFWPIFPEVLEEVTESVRVNGLRQPIVLDVDGRIIDGRTRYAACQALNVEPETVVYEGSDVLEFIQDANSSRRHVSTGARAMIIAQMMVSEGLRKDGKWAYGRLNSDLGQNSKNMQSYLTRAGVVLDWLPELAAQVVTGDLPLKTAYEQAVEARDRVDAEKRAKAIEANVLLMGLVLLDLMVADNGPEREGSNNALVCFGRGIVGKYFVSDCFNIEG